MNKRRIFDTLAVISNAAALSVNFLFFLPMLIEQIETGWGYPTDYEIMTVFFWFIQAMTVPFILFGFVYVLIALFRKKKDSWYFINVGMTVFATALLVLSVVFAFV